MKKIKEKSKLTSPIRTQKPKEKMILQNAIDQLTKLIGDYELVSINVVDKYTTQVVFWEDGEQKLEIFENSETLLEWLETNRKRRK